MTHNADELRRYLLRMKKLGRRSLRRWHVITVAIAVAVAAAVVMPRVIEPAYVSSTVLVYRELIPSTTLLGPEAPIETPRQRDARLKELLMARTNLETIIDELGLYPRVVAARGKSEAVEEFLKDAEVKVGEDTFAIKFTYNDPAVAKAATERLAQSLVDQSARYRLDQAKSTTKFLDAQRTKTKRELAEKEQALARFLSQHPEFAQDVLAPGGVSQAGASIRAQEAELPPSPISPFRFSVIDTPRRWP